MKSLKSIILALICIVSLSCSSSTPKDTVMALFGKIESSSQRLRSKGVTLDFDKIIYDDRIEEEKRIAVTEYGEFIQNTYCKNGRELTPKDLADICLGFKYISIKSMLSNEGKSIDHFQYKETFLLEEGRLAIVAYKAFPKNTEDCEDGIAGNYFLRKINGKWKIDDDAFEYELAIMKYNQYLKSKGEL